MGDDDDDDDVDDTCPERRSPSPEARTSHRENNAMNVPLFPGERVQMPPPHTS